MDYVQNRSGSKNPSELGSHTKAGEAFHLKQNPTNLEYSTSAG